MSNALALPLLEASTRAFAPLVESLVNPTNINFTFNFPSPRPKHHANAATIPTSAATMIHFLRRAVMLHVGPARRTVNLLRNTLFVAERASVPQGRRPVLL